MSKKITKNERKALLEELKGINSGINELLKASGTLNNGRRHINEGVMSFDKSDQGNQLSILINRKETIEEILHTSEIVVLESSPGTVSPGNIVKLQLTHPGEDSEIFLVALSENNSFGCDGSGGTASFSISSPLGQCILGKGVGFSGNYNVGNNVFLVEILEITEA